MGYGYPFSYIHTGEGALYLSMIWDLYDNSIAAYRAVAQQMVNLVLDTIRLAIKIEKTKAAAEVQLHSGQPVAIPNSFRGWAAEDILNSLAIPRKSLRMKGFFVQNPQFICVLEVGGNQPAFRAEIPH